MRNLVITDLDGYPTLGPLFVEKGLTVTELDAFLTRMEDVLMLPEAPEICKEDALSLHGDAVIPYANLVQDRPNGLCS
jgi:hypothetical protein